MSLEDLAQAVMNAGPDDAPPVADMLATAAPAPDPENPAADFDAAPASDLIPLETWVDQWGMIHDMAGGLVQARTGAPCPLGQQARSAGGKVAAEAAYSLLASTPVLANMFLGQNSTFLGQMMALGLHGFACVQMVKASQAGAVPE